MGEPESGSEGLGKCANEERAKNIIDECSARLKYITSKVNTLRICLESDFESIKVIEKQIELVTDIFHEMENNK